MFLKKEKIPQRPWPWICGTPMAKAIDKRDKSAVKKAYDFQFSQQLAAYEWDLKFTELSEIERAEIQIEIGELRKYQKQDGFGPWYHENDIEEKIKFKS